MNTTVISLILNISLLMLGTLATLSAFVGETWVKGSDRLAKRITRRGWMSLLCLAGALILGSVKEFVSERADQKIKQERDDAKSQLTQAGSKLDTLRKNLDEAEVKLNGAHDLLDLLSKNLTSTKEQLSRESELNLITALSKENPIRDAAWWIEMQGDSSKAQDIEDYLFSRIPPEYKDAALGTIVFEPFLGMSAVVDYQWDDGKVTRSFSSRGVERDFVTPETALPPFLNPSRDLYGSRGRESNSTYILSQKTTEQQQFTSAAIAYRDLMEGRVIGEVSIKLRRCFETQDQMNSFLSSHASLHPFFVWKERNCYRVDFALPHKIAAQFVRYWTLNLRRSHIHLYLRNSADLMMSCDVAIKNRIMKRSEVILVFSTITKPKLEIGIREE